jgi:WD40 repeat protein
MKNNGFKIWKSLTRHVFTDFTYSPESLTFSPDNKTLAVGGSSESKFGYAEMIRLWDMETGALLNSFRVGNTSRILSLAFSPDGQILASGQSRPASVIFWDIQAGSQVDAYPVDSSVSTLRFLPDGTAVMLGSGIYDIDDNLIDSFERRASAYGLTTLLSNDGKVAVTSDVGIDIYQIGSDNILSLLTTIDVYQADYQASHIELSEENEVLGYSGVRYHPPLENYYGGDCVGVGGVSPSHNYLVINEEYGASDMVNYLRLCDVINQAQITFFEGGPALAFNSDGSIMAASTGNHQGSYCASVELRDTLTGEITQSFNYCDGSVRSIAFSPDNSLLAMGIIQDRQPAIEVWDIQREELLTTLIGHTNRITALVFSVDSRLLISSSDDKTLRLWGVFVGE